VHVLIVVLYMGEIEFTKVVRDDGMARLHLADWCANNWHDEDSSPSDFSNEDMIEWYFDTYEDYSYYRQPIQVPNVDKPAVPVQGEDILLTPGMCAIVHYGLRQVPYGNACRLLKNFGELDVYDDDNAQQQQAISTVSQIIDLFE